MLLFQLPPQLCIMHNLILKSEYFPIVTPLLPDKWRECLFAASILDEFSDVCLCSGFHLGVSSSITSVFFPNNHKSALDNPSIIDDHISNKIKEGRYSCGYTPEEFFALFGPFCTAPLGICFNKPLKPCLIQDHSFSHNNPSISSVNSEIDLSAFTCDWGSFLDCFFHILNAPPGTQVAIFNIESTHCHMPIAIEDCLHVCISWKKWVHMDHSCCFRCTSSSGIFGHPADAIVKIYIHKKVNDVIKWADDFAFSPSIEGSWHYCFDKSLIWDVVKDLSWPWSLKPSTLHSTTSSPRSPQGLKGIDDECELLNHSWGIPWGVPRD